MKPQRQVNVSDIDELQKVLDRDADAILNIKRDITLVQQVELRKAYDLLLKHQRDYDAAKISNRMKEHQLADLLDKEKELKRINRSRGDSGSELQSTVDTLQKSIAVAEEKLAADKRTRSVLTTMSNRLEAEIEDLRSKSQQVSQTLDIKRTELHGLSTTVRSSRQELLEEERKLADLVKMMKTRASQRVEKMSQLQSLVAHDPLMNSEIQVESSDEGFAVEALRLFVRKSPEGRFLNSRGSTADTTQSERLQETELYTKEQIMDAIDRYNNRKSRVEKLEALQSEFREKISFQKKRKSEMEDILQKLQQSHTTLASSRQVYQEVDSKDSALNAARRQCLESKEKDKRLLDSIESLRRFMPRLLAKITKLQQPLPSVDQFPDSIHKLNDEVSRLIKLIGETLLREATPEDLAAATDISGQGGEDRSESARLHKLPGFTKMQKQLFINLMAAHPDATNRNVRVPSRAGQLAYLASFDNQLPSSNTGYGSYEGSSAGPNITGYGYQDVSLDRNTVKDISRLVIDRDLATKSKTSHTHRRYVKQKSSPGRK